MRHQTATVFTLTNARLGSAHPDRQAWMRSCTWQKHRLITSRSHSVFCGGAHTKATQRRNFKMHGGGYIVDRNMVSSVGGFFNGMVVTRLGTSQSIPCLLIGALTARFAVVRHLGCDSFRRIRFRSSAAIPFPVPPRSGHRSAWSTGRASPRHGSR